MTDEQINEAIALHLGWRGIVSDPSLGVMGKWEEATDKDFLTVEATTEDSSVDQREVQG